MSCSRPPAWLRRLAETLVRGPHREWILGDLEEMHAARLRNAGRLQAHASYAGWVTRTALARARSAAASGARGDLRTAFRQLRFHPRVYLLGAGILAVGLGVTTFVWGVQYGAFGRGLPVSEPDRMLALETVDRDAGIDPFFSPRDLELVSDRGQLDGAGLWGNASATLHDEEGPPERARVLELSPSVFGLLEARPAVGRLLAPEDGDAEAAPVVVLGHRFWVRRYGGDPEVVGRTLRIDGRPVQVVGVLSEGRSLFDGQRYEQLYLPVGAWTDPVARRYRMIIRSPTGVGATAVSDRLAALGPALSGLPPGAEGSGPESALRVRAVPFAGSFRGDLTSVYSRVLTFLGILLFVLSVANVTNLFLVRAMTRSREMAVRKASGAGGLRILRQLALEAAFPAALGILGGGLLASAGLRWYQRAQELSAGGQLVTWEEYRLTLPHLGILAAAAVASTVVVSVVVGMVELRRSHAAVLRSGRRGTGRFRLGRALVGLEVAAAGALALLAGLMVRSAWNLRANDWGFAMDGVTTGHVVLDSARYATREARAGFWGALARDLENLAGAESVALATQLPMTRYGGPTWEESRRIEVEGRTSLNAGELPVHYVDAVSARFFVTFRTDLASGADLLPWREGAARPVVVVNRPFADRYFPDEDPVGRRIRIWLEGEAGPWRTVVGVAPDLWMDADEDQRPEGVYVPIDQAAPLEASFAIRGGGGGMADQVRRVVAALDPELPVVDVRGMDDIVQGLTSRYGRDAPLFISLGVAALLLALVGTYVVVSYLASLRMAEYGIRVALGAHRGGLVVRSMRAAVSPALWGGVVGLAVGLWIVRGFARFMFQVDPWSPGVAASVLLLVLGTTAWAALVPALRAGRADPRELLRVE